MQASDPPKTKKPYPATPAELRWAKEKVIDILFGCHLNYRLKRAGWWPKYLCDMSDDEFLEYARFIESLHRAR